jgi:hypothetical protein
MRINGPYKTIPPVGPGMSHRSPQTTRKSTIRANLPSSNLADRWGLFEGTNAEMSVRFLVIYLIAEAKNGLGALARNATAGSVALPPAEPGAYFVRMFTLNTGTLRDRPNLGESPEEPGTYLTAFPYRRVDPPRTDAGEVECEVAKMLVSDPTHRWTDLFRRRH